MAKAEWGEKHRCLSCGTPFYDLNRDPIVCPKCATRWGARKRVKPEPRRAPVKPPVEPPKPKPVAALQDEADVDRKDQLEGMQHEVKAAPQEQFIEDPSELGEDEDDMAEVLEGAAAGEGAER